MAYTYDYNETTKIGDLKSFGITQFSVDSELNQLHNYLATDLWFRELNDGRATINVTNKSVTFSNGETFTAKGDETRQEIVAAVDAIASITGWTTQKSINFLKVIRSFIVLVMKSRGA